MQSVNEQFNQVFQEDLEMIARAKADVARDRYPTSKHPTYTKAYIKAQEEALGMIEVPHSQIKGAL